MGYSFKLSGRSGVLALDGSLTIEDADALKTALVDALRTAEALEIDLSGVADVSLCCLQVLCSAHRTAHREAKTLALRNPGEEFLQSLRETGYRRHKGCETAGDQDCLWADAGGAEAGKAW